MSFNYEKFYARVPYFDEGGAVYWNNQAYAASQIAAVANKYDIIKELGEDGIRSKVEEEYGKWKTEVAEYCTEEYIKENAPDLDDYVNALSQHYGHISSSTDFKFYNGKKTMAFAKDLKTYDGTTLEYVGIMPKEKNLKDYIKSTSAQEINEIIGKLKPISLDSFKDGVITSVHGYIPHFDFDYALNLKDDLIMIGIEDIFDEENADLSGIVDEKKILVNTALHKANIDFSNSGIKAGAATVLGGGLGATSDKCHPFYYSFDVPVKDIQLDFTNPYLFLIRDKDSGEVWFTGAVYEPKALDR